MTTRTVPFHYGLFYHAMISLIGREPDSSHRYGMDGTYMFRYEPKDATERKKLMEAASTLQEWLAIFELTPLKSHCEFGRLVRPQEDQVNKDYLDIVIVHPVESDKKT